MEYPPNIKSRRAEIVYGFFRILYAFEVGKGRIIGRFTGWWTEFALLYLVLDKLGITPTLLQVIIVGVILILVCYTLGRYYMHYSIDMIEVQVNQERDPMIKQIYDKIVKKGGKKI